jgi:hypothetical protein
MLGVKPDLSLFHPFGRVLLHTWVKAQDSRSAGRYSGTQQNLLHTDSQCAQTGWIQVNLGTPKALLRA